MMGACGRSYDVDEADAFWTAHAGDQFPEVLNAAPLLAAVQGLLPSVKAGYCYNRAGFFLLAPREMQVRFSLT